MIPSGQSCHSRVLKHLNSHRKALLPTTKAPTVFVPRTNGFGYPIDPLDGHILQADIK